MLPCLCSRKSLSSISSMPCQSSTSLVFLDLAINSFLSRTILVFNSVPLRHLPFFSVVSTLYSSRYLPPRLLYNIVDTLFNPSLRLTSVFPAFSSAISSIFYQLAFVNVPSYSVPITFNLFPTRLFSSHPPSLARILANSH